MWLTAKSSLKLTWSTGTAITGATTAVGAATVKTAVEVTKLTGTAAIGTAQVVNNHPMKVATVVGAAIIAKPFMKKHIDRER